MTLPMILWDLSVVRIDPAEAQEMRAGLEIVRMNAREVDMLSAALREGWEPFCVTETPGPPAAPAMTVRCFWLRRQGAGRVVDPKDLP